MSKQTWYKIAVGFAKITPVTVTKETGSQVVIESTTEWGRSKGEVRTQRVNKTSSYESYFPTWEAAHRRLLKESEEKMKSIRRQLELETSLHGNIKGMKKPEDTP